MWPCMKLKHLQALMQQLDSFEKPKIHLEQYITPPELSSQMIYTIQTLHGDIENKIVADFGSGCGNLTIGAAAIGAGLVIGFEVDEDALAVSYKNIEEQEFANIDIVHCDIVNGFPMRYEKFFDTVIMNPPFGTKNNEGIDTEFLKKAFELSHGSVYSLHKTSTRAYLTKFAKNCGISASVIAELRYNLPATYKFHKQKSVDIEVDLFKFDLSQGTV